jgi:hypothetical protein
LQSFSMKPKDVGLTTWVFLMFLRNEPSIQLY